MVTSVLNADETLQLPAPLAPLRRIVRYGGPDVACLPLHSGTHTGQLEWHRHEGRSMALHGTAEIDRFDTHVDATAGAVADARTAFERWLRGTEASEDTVHELTVVFSELVANAVDASPGVHQEIEAVAWTEGGNIVLRVANPVTSSAVPVMEPDLSDPLRTGGRGLLIVRAYTDSVEVESDDGTIAICCARRIAD